MRAKPRYIIEYVLIRGVAFIINHLPYRSALAVGWFVAWLGFYVFRFRVREATLRIQEVFNGRFNAGEVRQMAWRSWRNFIFSGVEMIRIPVSTATWVKSVVEVGDSIEKVLAHLKTGQGAIIATVHMGSWEMAGLTGLAYSLPLFSLAAPQKNPLVDEYLNQLRGGTGFETLLRTDSVLKSIIRKIREGKVLAILLDVRSKTEGLSIRFLGKTANVAGGMGLIARQTGVSVFPCVITRIGWTRHRYRVFDPIRPDPALDKKADWFRMTQAVFDIFDQCIRAEPEQWFWFNKRWIFDPLEKVPASETEGPEPPTPDDIPMLN